MTAPALLKEKACPTVVATSWTTAQVLEAKHGLLYIWVQKGCHKGCYIGTIDTVRVAVYERVRFSVSLVALQGGAGRARTLPAWVLVLL